MKATLTFDLPQDGSEYKIHSNATAYYGVITDLLGDLRAAIKYGETKNFPGMTTEQLQLIRERIYELADEHKAEMDV